MSLSNYAEAFTALGYACLVFDYRRWGASGQLSIQSRGSSFCKINHYSLDGTPRQIIQVKEQLEDYRTVISYARQQPEFDPQQVILWGSSFSGTHIHMAGKFALLAG